MKIIIEIPEKTNAHIRSDYGHGVKGLYDEDREILCDAIYHGTPYRHGEWLISSDRTRACCPFCHNKWADAKEIALLDTVFSAKNFCEYCGADMRGKQNEID